MRKWIEIITESSRNGPYWDIRVEKAGRSAFYNEQSLKACPYRAGSKDAKTWSTGWLDAKAEAAPLEEKSNIGHLAAAAALATGGYHVGKEMNLPVDDPMPRIVVIPDSDGPPLDDGKVKLHTPDKKENINEATKLLALTIWAEGRSGGPEAMRAVAHVIMNRVHSERAFGDTVKEVVWKRKAFSCWNPGDPNREAMARIPHLSAEHLSKKRWYEAVDIAKDVLSGRDNDPTNGALFYHTEAMGKPYWVSDNMKPIAHIGDHLFYRTDAKS